MLNPLRIAIAGRLTRVFAMAFGVAAVSLMVGCGSGGKESKNSVSGKVLLEGKAVDGTVVFVTADNKELMSPITASDGSYQINDAPNGTAKIYIKSSLASAGVGKTIDAKTPAGAPEMPKTSMGDKGVPAPAKYGSAASSGLTVEVKGGKQVHDITLTP